MVYLQRWHGWCHMKLLPSRRVLCTPYSHAPCHFMQSHIRKVHACLAVTCYLHFWQNGQDLLRATAVIRARNGYRTKSQSRKLTLEKTILPPLLQEFERTTFRSGDRRSNHWAIPAPLMYYNVRKCLFRSLSGTNWNHISRPISFTIVYLSVVWKGGLPCVCTVLSH